MLFSSPTLFRIHIFPYPLFHFNLSPSSSTFIETTVPLLSFSSHSSKLTYPPFPISPFYLHQSPRFSLFTFPIFIPKLPFLPLLLIRRPYLSYNRLKISAKKTSLSAPSCSTCSSQSHEHRLVVFLCYLFASENNRIMSWGRVFNSLFQFISKIEIHWLNPFAAFFRGKYLFFISWTD